LICGSSRGGAVPAVRNRADKLTGGGKAYTITFSSALKALITRGS